MGREEFSDTCKGCRPCAVNMATGQIESDDSPIMRIINAVWEGTTLEERQAFHEVTCNNSRAEHHMLLMKSFNDKVAAGLETTRAEKIQ